MDEETIRGWKKTYGQVFSVDARGEEHVFRPLTHREFLDVRALGTDSAEAEEEIVAATLLHPAKISDRMPAGVITSMAQQIMEVSGFGSPAQMKATLEQKRAQIAGNPWSLMKALVLATIPAYTEEDLDNLTFDQLAAKVALGEQIIQIQQSSVGVEHEVKLDIIDPEEREAQEAALRQKEAAKKKPGTASMNDPIARKLIEALR